jgi:pimeloyl-ACP methyl ester carboxylesterase
MEMKTVYIHGASATGESFNYIRSQMPGDDIVLEYDSRNGFDNNLDIMIEQLESVDEMFFVCHSLGGIYALHIADYYRDRVQGAFTLSTPYGGAEIADYAKYFYFFSRLLKDIGPRSGPMTKADKIDITWPWTNVVTTKGSAPWIIEPNDGVVTLSSQRAHKDMELVDVDYNHYEVVLAPSIVEIIRARLP